MSQIKAPQATGRYRRAPATTDNPVEFTAAKRDDLVEWVLHGMGVSLAAPDLSAAGYRFIGGRLVATKHGPAALFGARKHNY